VTPESSCRTLAARRASCWDRKTALGAPSARQCDPREKGRFSRRPPRAPRAGLFLRLTASILPGICHLPCQGEIRARFAVHRGLKRPRRAMIRRRGKRGRIRRAGASAAYENRTQLTSDAGISAQGARCETIHRKRRDRPRGNVTSESWTIPFDALLNWPALGLEIAPFSSH
jgi:hypothetical protein